MEVVLDALKDSLIILPFLLGAYILIEVIEALTSKRLNNRLLKSKVAPLFGASFGLLPQCGFSVVATDLYTQRKLTLGTLIAIYISTSDEAIPLLIAEPSKIGYLLPLLLIKFIYGLLLGFGIDAVVRLIEKRKQKYATLGVKVKTEPLKETKVENAGASEIKVAVASESEVKTAEALEHAHVGCCGHHIEEEENEKWYKKFLLHPLLHTLKIFIYILIINLIFGGIVALIGEDNLTNFLASSSYFAPLISVAIGIIPNCASSIVITELFLKGGLTFGACLAGLCANAGLGFVILAKQNKSVKNNLTILAIMVIASLVIGYAVQLVMNFI